MSLPDYDSDQLYRYCHKHYGLTEETVRGLRLGWLDCAQTAVVCRRWSGAQAIEIPYTVPPATFFRYRRVGAVPSVLETPKYWQSPGTPVMVYFPPIVEWQEILGDRHQSLIITEGEFKAARACQDGLPTIALGGVWNWMRDKVFHPDLASIAWHRRRVYVIFDSDITSNIQVLLAAQRLTAELLSRGADPRIVALDATGSDKVGLDDYLNQRGLEALYSLIEAAPAIGNIQPMLALDAGMVTVTSMRATVDRESLVSVSDTYIRRQAGICTVPVLDAKTGKLVEKRVTAGSAWLAYPLKTTVDKLIYEPGGGEFPYRNGVSYYNTWRGWATQPKPGDVEPFLRLIRHLLGDYDPTWLLQWLAYPLQYPGTKLTTAVVMAGAVHGTGKSMIGYTMRRIYGRNYAEITQRAIMSDFTYELADKQFVMGDEITGFREAREFADQLKSLITRETIWINRKNAPKYEADDCINYYFTTNHFDSFYVEDTDRRIFYHEVEAKPLPEEFYSGYVKWLKEEGGDAHLFDYLLNQVDTSGFNPAGRAPLTEAKATLIRESKSRIENDLIELRDGIIDPYPDRDLYTAQELADILDPDGRAYSNILVGRKCRVVGIPRIQVHNGKTCQNYFALHGSFDKWSVCSHKVRWEHVQSTPLVNKKY